MYELSYLESLSRKELQSLAKEHGIKANLSTAKIIGEILKKHATQDIEQPEDSKDILSSDIKQNDEMISSYDKIVEEPSTINISSNAADIPSEKEILHVSVDESMDESSDYHIGDVIEAMINEVWVEVEVVRINKKSIRVMNRKTGWSKSLSYDMIRSHMISPVEISSITSIRVSSRPTSRPTSGISDKYPIIAQESMIIIPEPMEVISSSISLSSQVDEDDVIIAPDSAIKSNNISIRNKLHVFKASRSSIGLKNKTTSGNTSRSSTHNHPHTSSSSSSSSRVTITPKLTKAQIARQEAISKKLRGDDLLLSLSYRTTTPSSSSIIKPHHQRSASVLPSSINRFAKPTAASHNRSSLSTTAPSSSSSVTPSESKLSSRNAPDFAKAHAKAFEKSKSIVDIVHRDENITKKMDTAYHHSVQFGFDPVHDDDHHSSNKDVIVSSHNHSTTSTSTTPFKARTMPDFKSLHKKSSIISSSSSSSSVAKTPGKENHGGNRLIVPTISSSAKSHVAVRLNKGTGVSSTSNRDNKRAAAQVNAKDSRQAMLAAKRAKDMTINIAPESAIDMLPSSHDIPFAPMHDVVVDENKIYASSGFANPFISLVSALSAVDEY